MMRTWIGAVALAAVTVGSAGYAGALEKSPGQDQASAAQQTQKDRDPPPGAENMDKRAERMQNPVPMGESQGQNPAGKSNSD